MSNLPKIQWVRRHIANQPCLRKDPDSRSILAAETGPLVRTTLTISEASSPDTIHLPSVSLRFQSGLLRSELAIASGQLHTTADSVLPSTTNSRRRRGRGTNLDHLRHGCIRKRPATRAVACTVPSANRPRRRPPTPHRRALMPKNRTLGKSWIHEKCLELAQRLISRFRAEGAENGLCSSELAPHISNLTVTRRAPGRYRL
jgi:hypothetical protein